MKNLVFLSDDFFKKTRRKSYFLFFLGASFFTCHAWTQPSLKQITLLLDWQPNTNHAGFFAAKEEGFYKKEGLEVQIVNPTQTTTTVLVGQSKANFGVSYFNDLIYASNKGIPVVSLAGIISTSTSCFVWRKSAQISDIKDFEGKRYGGWGNPEENAIIQYVMEQNHADFSKLKIFTIGEEDFFKASLKQIDIGWEYKAWGILAAQLKHIEVSTYCPYEHFPVFNHPSPIIITSRDFLKNQPELVKKFMNATKKGFEFTIKNPQKAGEDFIKQVPGVDENLVRASVIMLSNLYQGKSKNWGDIDKNNTALYVHWMRQVGLIDKEPNVDDLVSAY